MKFAEDEEGETRELLSSAELFTLRQNIHDARGCILLAVNDGLFFACVRHATKRGKVPCRGEDRGGIHDSKYIHP
jgi:hypothetical protein